ncbi:MAG TPA: molybdopterin cofactor-binding domain-containing protein [Solirubrobacteraceae bacterium]|nr:molybdopterin cofactor-binding domain-containing protein [Solirubrobacteraceae bacterium]
MIGQRVRRREDPRLITGHGQIVAEYLGLPVERVTVLEGDTAEAPRGAGTYGSKSTQIGGVAARGAAEEVLERRMISVDDAGRIINAMIADGQIHGGVASGIAQAIHEERVYDEGGNPSNGNFVTYGIPSASEFPAFELVRKQTPTPVNPLGAKGIGESGTIGSTPAVHNAVRDALAHLEVRHLGMPVNGENVWRAIADAAADRS